MGYDIRYEDMHSQREMYYQNLYTREGQLIDIRNSLLNICSMTEMTGAMADSVRAYIQEIHLPLIEWMLDLIETYRTNLVLYTDYYSKLDSDRMARFGQDCMEDQQQKLMHEKWAFQETADNIQGILGEVSGYMDIDGFDPSGVETAYDNAIAFVDDHKNAIGENEAVHQAYDMEPVKTMLDCILPILEEQLGGQAGTIETYQSGCIFDRTEYQNAITMSIGMQDYITQKEALVTQCNAFEYQQKKQWDDMVYHRETEAALQIAGAIGMGIVLTVSAISTAGFALPLVFGLYGTTTGIVATGTVTAVYAGAYTYQGSNLIEGVNSYHLAQEGDAAGIAVNPIRDTIFANNPELYYTLGEISTTVALSTPSIAGSMSTAVRLGVSPTRAALTEMGMLGGSEIAGRYVQAGVYEQTGDPRLASMARSGTSLLVYGGLAYADARMGMSGIRQWRTPQVNSLEFQPPEQTFTEPNAPLYQGNPSTYPAIAGSMSREEIEGYLASLRNGSSQGLKADGVSGLGIPELGNSESGSKTICQADRIKIDSWEYTPSDELYSKYKEVFDNPLYYDQKTGAINWPENNGFVSTSTDEILQPGTRVDRYGTDFGSFVCPEGVPYEMRALPPGTDMKPYSVFEVVKPINVKSGGIAPWFDEPGGGIQYLMPNTVDELLDFDVLRRVQ